ncbi:hypothetical protein BCR34DRAFT_293057 [Clohesyomyces aquaticus]|uniref:Uncharacterized protein n=1 Tax=Clohesyomyces aquaticus TaxID=1231657 RepID=A0A1Y2A8V3_9PLEO|nr:hypothetical protein BCR34DRAFT_293057 [Clohesyomyces aquaticus]
MLSATTCCRLRARVLIQPVSLALRRFQHNDARFQSLKTFKTVPGRTSLQELNEASANEAAWKLDRDPTNEDRDYTIEGYLYPLQGNFGNKLATVISSKLNPAKKGRMNDQNPRILCSYNLDQQGNLYVPGAPRCFWKNKTSHEYELPLPTFDSWGPKERIDKHIERSFDAIRIMTPSFNYNDIDIICSFECLCALWEFAAKHEAAFGFVTHLINRTLVMDISSRPSATPWRKARYFQDYFTAPEAGIPPDSRHFRWIYYTLGQLRCAVLVEVDAHVAEPLSLSVKVAAPSQHRGKFVPNTKVTKAGRDISQSELIDLQIVDQIASSEGAMLTAYFSFISTFYKAVLRSPLVLGKKHKGRIVHRLRHDNYVNQAMTWKGVSGVKKMISLLVRIQEITTNSQYGACTGFAQGGLLHIFEPTFRRKSSENTELTRVLAPRKEIFPREITERFWLPEGVKKNGVIQKRADK